MEYREDGLIQVADTQSVELRLGSLHDAFSRSPVATVVLQGSEYAVCYANPAFCAMVEAVPDDLVGRPLSRLLFKEHADAMFTVLDRVYETGEPQRAPALSHTDADDHEAAGLVWPIVEQDALVGLIVQAQGTRIGSGSGTEIVNDLRTVNERLVLAGIEAQEQVEEVRHDLEARLEFEREMDNFLIEVAHDLKTPLTTIKGFTQLLLRNLDRDKPINSGQATPHLLQIDKTVARMVAQIDVLLARQRTKWEKSRESDLPLCNLSELVARVVSTHEEQWTQQRILLQVDVDDLKGPWTTLEIERVVWNLISNAIKYSPDGGDIEVHVWRDDHGACAQGVLSVQDHGIGIPVLDLPHVFERHFRASNAQKFTGNGIGLAGVKEIMDRHGGTVSAESHGASGTTFTIRLPLGAPDAA